MTAGYAIAFRTILFLAGLIFLLVILTQGIRRGSTRRMLASSVGLGFVILAVIMGSWKTYQCKFTIPDEIDIVGHVKGNADFYLNDYWVILYKDNVEIDNYLTRKGSFGSYKKDKENDGFFLFKIPNTYQITRCTVIDGFKQASAGRNILWFRNKSTYLWQDFSSLGPGAYLSLTQDPEKPKYTLVVMPRGAGDYPNELNMYRTYLDPSGNDAAINLPIKTYIMAGNSAIETITDYYVQEHPRSNAPQGVRYANQMEVHDAWVEDIITTPINLISDTSRIAGEEIVDIDNCKGSEPIDRTETRSKVYFHEVQFQGSPFYDLGQVAIKAAPSLGFMQGKIAVSDASIIVRVPAWTHLKYKIVWHDQWKTGNIRVDSGITSMSIPFRARVGLSWEPLIFSVDCPAP